eukprot:scaffold2526_cov131-Cylindrotheca_fusiformis.AAC.21
MDSLERVFNLAVGRIGDFCSSSLWKLDKNNLEGVRVSTGEDGGFFMLRKSLHDPVLSLQIEAASNEHAKANVIEPLLSIFQAEEDIVRTLDYSQLRQAS